MGGLGFAGVRGWIVALALAAVTVAAGVGLWLTWDSTRVSDNPSLTADDGPELLANPTTTDAATTAPTTPTRIPPCGHGDEPVEGDPQAD